MEEGGENRGETREGRPWGPGFMHMPQSHLTT